MTQQIPDPHPLIPRKYSSTSCSSPPSAARRLYRNLSGKFRTANLAMDDTTLPSQSDKDHSHKTTMVRCKHFNKNYAITETKIALHDYCILTYKATNHNRWCFNHIATPKSYSVKNGIGILHACMCLHAFFYACTSSSRETRLCLKPWSIRSWTSWSPCWTPSVWRSWT